MRIYTALVSLIFGTIIPFQNALPLSVLEMVVEIMILFPCKIIFLFFVHFNNYYGSIDANTVLPLHAERQFYCLTPDNTYSHTWKVNGTVVTSNSTFPGVVYITSQTLSNGSTQGSLTFRAYANANNTNIECFFANGSKTIPELEHLIVIQGEYIM